MHKEPSENIYNILLDIREKIGVLTAAKGEHDVKLDRLIEQTTKTNGRVTKLEDTVVTISNAHAKLVEMTSKQNGIYSQNLKIIEENVSGCTREIDELKKKVNSEVLVESDIKKINTENGWKFKLAVWATISTIVIAYFTWLFTNTNVIEVKKEIINELKQEKL